MNNKKNLLILLTIFLLTLSLANGFELTSTELQKSVCPSNTILFAAAVSGEGNFNLNYEGSASSFATIVPQSFTLNNERSTIYTYITPKLGTSPGRYGLTLMVTSGEKKTINYEIEVLNCNQVTIAGTENKELCACNEEVYEYNVINLGNYEETYTAEATGNGASFVTLSEKEFKLKSKESKKLAAYYKAPCGSKGDYEFDVNIKSLTSNALASFNSKTKVNSCYDFNLAAEKTFLNMCEHTIEKIPLSIENTAANENEFSLLITGPAWANLERDSLELKTKEKQDVNLILNPDYAVEGSFDVNLKVKSKEAKLIKEQIIKIDVRKCNNVIVDIEKNEDNVCNTASKQYNVKIKNTGEFDKDFKLESNLPWTSLSTQSVNVKAGKEENVVLNVNPNKELTGKFDLKVKAAALDTSKVYHEDSINLDLLEVNKCYSPLIEVENRINLKPDTTATIELKVTNKGFDKANYLLSLTGKASNFVQLNPATLEIEPSKTEVIYLYIAPPFNTPIGLYDALINIKVGSDILASKKLEIDVTEVGCIGVKKEEKIEEVKELSLWNKFLVWLKENLSAKPEIKENKSIEINDVNSFDISKNNIINQDVKFKFKNEEHNIKIKEVQNTSLVLEITSNPQYVILDLNETEKIDIDRDGIYDLELTLEEIKEGKPIIKSKSVNEKILEERIEEKAQEPSQYSQSLLSFLTAYKFYVILGIIILIVLILIF